jgi:MFS family permease
MADERTRLLHDVMSNEPRPSINQGGVEKEVEVQQPASRGRRIVVEPLVFMVVFCFAGYIPLRQQYVYKRMSDKYNVSAEPKTSGSNCPAERNDTNSSSSLQAQEEAALWFMVINLASGIPAVFVVLLFGSQSDIWGRKFTMIMSLVGFVCQSTMGFVTIACQGPLVLIVAAEICVGLFGGAGLILATSLAYIADTTTETSRPLRLTLVEGMAGAGATIALVAMGFAISKLKYLWPALILLALHVINLLYVILFVPETIRRTQEENSSRCKSLCNCDTIKHAMAPVFRRDSNLCKRLLLMFALMLFLFSYLTHGDVSLLFVKNRPFCLGPVMIGLRSGFTAFMTVGGSIVTIAVFRKLFKVTPATLSLLGLVSSTLINVYIGVFVSQIWELFVGKFLLISFKYN